MRRQRYFPQLVSQRPEWFGNYASQLDALGASLGLVAADVDASVADALYLEYCSGAWLTAVREFSPAGTAALEVLYDAPGGAPFVLPVFTAPPLPAAAPPLPAVVAVPSGALQRIFNFVQIIKAMPAYTEAIGLQLGVVGAEVTTENPLPTFTLAVEDGTGCQCVKVNFKKYGRDGVAIYSKRGAGDWALLAIDTATPYKDERPLLVEGQPEVRQYRLRFYENDAATGGTTDIASATVGT